MMLRGRKAEVQAGRPPVSVRIRGGSSAIGLAIGIARPDSTGSAAASWSLPGLILGTGMPTIAAIGSSLVAVGTFGMTTAVNYAVSGLVDWPVALLFILGGIGGGWIGARLAKRLQRNAIP